MARTNLETLSPKELETALEQARARERAEVKAKLIALAEQLGFSEGKFSAAVTRPCSRSHRQHEQRSMPTLLTETKHGLVADEGLAG